MARLFTSQMRLSHKKLQKPNDFARGTPTEAQQEFCLQKGIRSRDNICILSTEKRKLCLGKPSRSLQRTNMLALILATLLTYSLVLSLLDCKPSEAGNLGPCVCTSALIRAYYEKLSIFHMLPSLLLSICLR